MAEEAHHHGGAVIGTHHHPVPARLAQGVGAQSVAVEPDGASLGGCLGVVLRLRERVRRAGGRHVHGALHHHAMHQAVVVEVAGAGEGQRVVLVGRHERWERPEVLADRDGGEDAGVLVGPVNGSATHPGDLGRVPWVERSSRRSVAGEERDGMGLDGVRGPGHGVALVDPDLAGQEPRPGDRAVSGLRPGQHRPVVAHAVCHGGARGRACHEADSPEQPDGTGDDRGSRCPRLAVDPHASPRSRGNGLIDDLYARSATYAMSRRGHEAPCRPSLGCRDGCP
jgi:hypothetical protein